MRRTMLFIALLVVSFFAACNNDNTVPESELAGEWNLISVTCFCPSVYLNPGENVWIFDTANNELIVESNIPAGTFFVPDSGIYEIAIDETANKIDIEFATMYDYFFVGNDTLIIDALIVEDEPRYELIKSE